MHLSGKFFAVSVLLLCAFLVTGCETTSPGRAHLSNAEMDAKLKAEGTGNYYIGRRYYKTDYKFWGWVRRPGQPWSTAKLVMMNEQSKLAPDREQGHIGSDNGYEYKLIGNFSDQPVYEPASNTVYQEFVLKGYDLVSAAPPNIYASSGALDPARRVIVRPN